MKKLTLYKRTNEGTNFCEFVLDEKDPYKITGVLGQEGKKEIIKKKWFSSLNKTVEGIINKTVSSGMREPTEEDYEWLFLSFEIFQNKYFNPKELEQELGDYISSLLENDRNGFISSVQYSKNSVEISCSVLDSMLAKKAMENHFSGSTPLLKHKNLIKKYKFRSIPNYFAYYNLSTFTFSSEGELFYTRFAYPKNWHIGQASTANNESREIICPKNLSPEDGLVYPYVETTLLDINQTEDEEFKASQKEYYKKQGYVKVDSLSSLKTYDDRKIIVLRKETPTYGSVSYIAMIPIKELGDIVEMFAFFIKKGDKESEKLLPEFLQTYKFQEVNKDMAALFSYMEDIYKKGFIKNILFQQN
tara:strand:+ start:21345 stop:22424 length:1080 start_codon:yes stop_codon:yes gene_type:complete